MTPTALTSSHLATNSHHGRSKSPSTRQECMCPWTPCAVTRLRGWGCCANDEPPERASLFGPAGVKVCLPGLASYRTNLYVHLSAGRVAHLASWAAAGSGLCDA